VRTRGRLPGTVSSLLASHWLRVQRGGYVLGGLTGGYEMNNFLNIHFLRREEHHGNSNQEKMMSSFHQFFFYLLYIVRPDE